MNRLQNIVYFGIFDAIYWSIMATFGSYMVAFALDKGFSQSVVSLMLSLYLAGGFIGQFFWGSICDRFQITKPVFIFGVTGAAVCQLILYETEAVIVFAIAYTLFGFFLGPMGTILDTWMLKTLHNDMKDYGVSRGFGSIGYAVVSFVMGICIKKYGYQIMSTTSSIAAIITLVIAFCTKDVISFTRESNFRIGDIKTLFKNRIFTVILLVLFLKNLAGTPMNSLKITLFRAVGGGVDTQGLDALFGCAIQFIFFEITGLLSRIPYQKRMVHSTLFLLASSALYLFAENSWMIICGSMFTNATYGLLMPAIREAVIDVVDPAYQTTANSLCDAMYSFLGGIISMAYAGFISERFGLRSLIAISAVLYTAALVIQVFVIRTLKYKKTAINGHYHELYATDCPIANAERASS